VDPTTTEWDLTVGRALINQPGGRSIPIGGVTAESRYYPIPVATLQTSDKLFKLYLFRVYIKKY